MKSNGVVVLIWLAWLTSTKANIEDSFFISCDKDRSKSISLRELEICVKETASKMKPTDIPQGVDANLLMKILDTNSDHVIDIKEYTSILQKEGSSSPADSEIADIKLTTHDGETKMVSREELFRKSGLSSQDLEMKDGNLMKKSLGKKNLTEIATENPGMSRYINFGKWAKEELMKSGHASGKMVQLRSLPKGGSINRGKEESTELMYDQYGNYELWMELCTKSVDNNTQLYYEVELEKDAVKYPIPHLAIINAWELNSKGERIKKLDVKPPRLRIFQQDWKDVVKKYCTHFVACIVLLVTLMWWICCGR